MSSVVANNFWGKDDAGVQPLLERMHDSKVTSDELKAFYSGKILLATLLRVALLTSVPARAAIEDEYARKLLGLCRKPLGSAELGSLRASLDTMRGEVESMGKAHQGIAGQMKSELEEPLAAFAGGLKERRKIVQSGIEKLLKIKVQQSQAMNKVRSTRDAVGVSTDGSHSRETATSKTVCASRAIWRRDTWSWDKKSARTRPNWKRLRFKWPRPTTSTRRPSRRSTRRLADGIESGRPHAM